MNNPGLIRGGQAVGVGEAWAGRAVAAALFAAPVAVVLQNRAVAPIALLGFLGAVILAWRGGWRPSRGLVAGPVLPAFALLAWMAAAAAWAIEPARALDTTLRVGAMVALAALAAHAAPRVPALPLVAGVALGLAMSGFDAAAGNGLRALVRGIAEPPPQLAFGLKNAAAVLALLLPLAVAALPDRRLALGLALAGGAVVLVLPGESAKIAVLAGLGAAAAARRFPRGVPLALGGALAVGILASPVLATAVLRPGLDASAWPGSAAHRLMVWDFAASRIAEAPLFGHGAEASRALPGGRDAPGAERLERFGLGGGRAAEWIARSEILPLHPHNLALQVWLELGAVGGALAAWLAWALGAAAARGPNPAGAAGALAAGSVVAMLSYGAWQHWWVAALALAAVAAARLSGLPPSGLPPSGHRRA